MFLLMVLVRPDRTILFRPIRVQICLIPSATVIAKPLSSVKFIPLLFGSSELGALQ